MLKICQEGHGSEVHEAALLRASLNQKIANGDYHPLSEHINKWMQRKFSFLPAGDLAPSIRRLSIVIRNPSCQLSVHAAIYTLSSAYVPPMPAFPIAYTYLIPLVEIFIFRQIVLSRIVNRARDLVLEHLHNGIESLDIEHHFDDPVLGSQFKAMAEYDDNIKHAHTGVCDVRTAC